jgi:hypothetical protein
LASAPPNLPIAVRNAPAITMSLMEFSAKKIGPDDRLA